MTLCSTPSRYAAASAAGAMPTKMSVPGVVEATSARAVPSAADSGNQSAPVARSICSLDSAKPCVEKLSASENTKPSVRSRDRPTGAHRRR